MFTLDLRSLAACRIATGLVILGDLANRACEFKLFYTDQGILPIEVVLAAPHPSYPSIYLMNGSWAFQATIFALHGLAALALCLGYRTRIATCLCWYLGNSLLMRNYLVNNGGDCVLLCLLFWSMFLPWGRRVSLDSLKRADTDDEANSILSVATAGLLSQFILMYWTSVYFKLEPTWLDGKAVYYALETELYSRPTRSYLLAYPHFLRLLCYGTFFWESAGPLLALSPYPRLRGLALLMFSTMHLSFGFFLRLGIFAFSPQLTLIALIPGCFWSPRVSPLTPRTGLHPALRAPLMSLMLFSWLMGIGQDQTGRTSPWVHPSLYWIQDWTGLRERWAVFVSLPATKPIWVLVEGILSDGSTVDIFQGRDPFSWEKPVNVSELHPQYRWPTPLVLITAQKELQPLFVRALALDWNESHPQRQVVEARLYAFYGRVLDDFRDSPSQPVYLCDWKPP